MCRAPYRITKAAGGPQLCTAGSKMKVSRESAVVVNACVWKSTDEKYDEFVRCTGARELGTPSDFSMIGIPCLADLHCFEIFKCVVAKRFD
jgi:hypothetical protein